MIGGMIGGIMHHVTGDRQSVEQLLRDTVNALEQARAGGKRKGAAGASIRAKRSTTAKMPSDVWREALGRMEQGAGERKGASAAGIGGRHEAARGRAVNTPFAPRDQMIALFQSAMDEYLDKTAPKSASAKPRAKAARAAGRSRAKVEKASVEAFYKDKPGSRRGSARSANILAKFGTLDPGWAKVVTEKAKLLFKGKRPFIAHTSPTDFRFSMADRTTVAIVGDWGGGNEAAQAVARQISRLKPDHVIHLGDVYYAGTPDEVKERFLKYWPTPSAPGRSFALNSNHEMYSGGYGYFEQTLKKFKQPASYFNLANAQWRFIGLDTGYDEHDLHAPQAEWLANQLNGPQKTILLSHHQLFSAYEDTDTSKLRGKVGPYLNLVYGWIWGHEHLAVVYEQHDGINAICLGNGCFPYGLPTSAATVSVKWLDDHRSDDPDYPGGHTFALFKIDGARIDIDFIDESGTVRHTESWN
jgi:predicted phosphodiesterase